MDRVAVQRVVMLGVGRNSSFVSDLGTKVLWGLL